MQDGMRPKRIMAMVEQDKPKFYKVKCYGCDRLHEVIIDGRVHICNKCGFPLPLLSEKERADLHIMDEVGEYPTLSEEQASA